MKISQNVDELKDVPVRLQFDLNKHLDIYASLLLAAVVIVHYYFNDFRLHFSIIATEYSSVRSIEMIFSEFRNLFQCDEKQPDPLLSDILLILFLLIRLHCFYHLSLLFRNASHDVSVIDADPDENIMTLNQNSARLPETLD